LERNAVSTALSYCSYAKINLYLDVLNKRRDGYNNIETLFQSVSLADRLSFVEARSRISLTCSSPELEAGEGNLVHQAALLLQERTGCKAGAKIHLEKRIPVAAGLAGGSGNAAATLAALNVLWDLRLPMGLLRRFALELGSDVPFCLQGGTALATRRGEDMRSLAPLRKTWFVLAHPPMPISASHTYNHPKLGRSAETPFAGRTPAFRRAIRSLEAGDTEKVLFNRMETPVYHDHPRLAELCRRLEGLGCSAAIMSGSGPTLFGLCRDKRSAQRMADKIGDYQCTVVSSMPVGVERLD
jgi:4-diphosphocytidyl-2-C-methyl-D-erythritol kinase